MTERCQHCRYLVDDVTQCEHCAQLICDDCVAYHGLVCVGQFCGDKRRLNAYQESTLADAPLPEEIEQRAEEIRRGWSERQRRVRAGLSPGGWRPPVWKLSSDFMRD